MFDDFGQALHDAENEHGYVKIISTDKNIDAYRAMVQRRNELRKAMNIAARNPVLRDEYGVECFSIDFQSGGKGSRMSGDEGIYYVNRLIDTIDVKKLAAKVTTLLTYDQQKLNLIVQGINFADCSTMEQFQILSGYETFQEWSRRLNFDTNELTRKIEQITAIFEAHQPKVSSPPDARLQLDR
jgi:hypothetical protein